MFPSAAAVCVLPLQLQRSFTRTGNNKIILILFSCITRYVMQPATVQEFSGLPRGRSMLQVVRKFGCVLCVRTDNPRERDGDEGRQRPWKWAPTAAAADAAPRFPHQLFRVFEVWVATPERRPVLSACGQPPLRARLAQATQGIWRREWCSRQHGQWRAQGQGGPASAGQGLDR